MRSRLTQLASSSVVLLALSHAGAALATPATIVVQIDGLRSDRGTVLVALYGSPSGWPEEGHELATCGARPSGGRARCSIHDVPRGRYGIALLHDEDDDGALDRGLFGLPTEGFGFSNDAPTGLGPPSFESAAFDHDGGETSVRIRARYL